MMKVYSTNRNQLLLIKEELEEVISGSDKNYSKILELFDKLSFVDSLKDDEQYIRFQVYSILEFYSGVDIKKIKDNDNLKFDLGLNNSEKWMFKKKFNAIIRDLGGEKFVTRKECNDLERVKDCIKLIKSKL